MGNKNNPLKVNIEYKELRLNLEGAYDDVWKSVNEFFKEIRNTLSPEISRAITVKGKNVPEILIELRNQGFFDEPRTVTQIYSRISELGKTEITPNAVSMSLKDLSAKGEFQRFKKGRGYVYIAPYVDPSKYRE
jgi:hypothetical protein